VSLVSRPGILPNPIWLTRPGPRLPVNSLPMRSWPVRFLPI